MTYKFDTLAIRHGFIPDPTTKAVAVPIYHTTSYTFDDTAHGAALFNLRQTRNINTINMMAIYDNLMLNIRF